MFNVLFPPNVAPINAGFMSMVENDIYGRVYRICQELEDDWGSIIPSTDIITEALAEDHLDYWMLPQSARDLLDRFDIVEN